MHLEVYVEEPSAEAALEVLLPKMLRAGVTFRIHNMGDKPTLLARLPARLAAYHHLPTDDMRVLVLVDRDRENCYDVKRLLEQIAARAGHRTRTIDPLGFKVVNRVVCEELEAWFFGDVSALVAAYPRVSANLGAQARFREPDAIPGGTWEALERVLKAAGYFPGGLAKIEAARAIARHMEPGRNRSASFQALYQAVANL